MSENSNFIVPFIIDSFLRDNGYRFGGETEENIYYYKGCVGLIDNICTIKKSVIKPFSMVKDKIASHIEDCLADNLEVQEKWKNIKI